MKQIKTSMQNALNKLFGTKKPQTDARCGAYSVYLKNTTDGDQPQDIPSQGIVPMVSIIVTMNDSDVSMLKRTLESIKNQTYKLIETSLVTLLDKPCLGSLEGYGTVHMSMVTEPRDMLDAAFGQCSGELIAFMNSGDILHPNAIELMTSELCKFGGCEFVYSDYDETDKSGERSHPHFLPNYSSATLLCHNYIGRPGLVSKSLYKRVGGPKSMLPADMYSFVMAAAITSVYVAHVGRVLYSVYEPDQSTLGMRAAIDELLEKTGVNGFCQNGLYDGSFRVRYILKGEPKLAIVIPNLNEQDRLRKCLEAIDDNSLTDNYELLISDRGSTDPRTLRYYDILEKNKAARIVRTSEPISMARAMNTAADLASADAYLFLSPKTKLILPNSLDSMLELCMQKHTGAVGAKLIDPIRRIYEAGLVIGLNGWAGSLYKGTHEDPTDEDFNRFVNSVRTVSAVSANAMMISSERFQGAGQFDVSCQQIGYDIALCIELYRKGYMNVYTPYARFMYEADENEPTFYNASDDDLARCYDIIRTTLIHGDPFYSTSFDYTKSIPTIGTDIVAPIEINPIYKQKAES